MKSFLSRAVLRMCLEVFGEGRDGGLTGAAERWLLRTGGDGDLGWLHVITWASRCLGLYP